MQVVSQWSMIATLKFLHVRGVQALIFHLAPSVNSFCTISAQCIAFMNWGLSVTYAKLLQIVLVNSKATYQIVTGTNSKNSDVIFANLVQARSSIWKITMSPNIHKYLIFPAIIATKTVLPKLTSNFISGKCTWNKNMKKKCLVRVVGNFLNPYLYFVNTLKTNINQMMNPKLELKMFPRTKKNLFPAKSQVICSNAVFAPWNVKAATVWWTITTRYSSVVEF